MKIFQKTKMKHVLRFSATEIKNITDERTDVYVYPCIIWQGDKNSRLMSGSVQLHIIKGKPQLKCDSVQYQGPTVSLSSLKPHQNHKGHKIIISIADSYILHKMSTQYAKIHKLFSWKISENVK